ncbi:MAG: ARMT1-like domain-containing protein [Candidatus Bathyarchaeota archaeon]|nr:ARMT1-like domain-containing protein [Candidatus Bathyarchaeota archaeon]
MNKMKVGSRCGYCLLHRGYNMIKLSTDDEETRREAMIALLKLMGEDFNEETVPSVLGAERGRLIARITGCEDPYKERKVKENQGALEILPGLEKILSETPDEEKLRTAAKMACLGNVIDYDVPGNNADLSDALKFLEVPLYIDDTDKLKQLIKKGTNLLFLTDNAGEVALDTLLVKELRRLGAYVTVAVKDGPPSLNDALMEDALMVGMDKAADKLITTGAKAIGVRLDESPQWFIDLYNNADVIVAKGMANWETMTETPAPAPTIYLYRTKCEPVARAVGAPEGESIAFLVEKGWKL